MKLEGSARDPQRAIRGTRCAMLGARRETSDTERPMHGAQHAKRTSSALHLHNKSFWQGILLQKRDGIPGKIRDIPLSFNILAAQYDSLLQPPFPHRKQVVECRMLSTIDTGLRLNRNSARSLLHQKVHFAYLGFVVVVQIETVNNKLLRHNVFQETPPIDRKIALDKIELHRPYRSSTQKPHIAEKEFEQIVAHVHFKRNLRRDRIIARQRNPRVRQPHEVAFIALHTSRFSEIG